MGRKVNPGRFRVRESTLQTARAWAYKEHAMTLWRYRSCTRAQKAWLDWYRSAIRCRLEPVKGVARMVKNHLHGSVTAVVRGVTSARAESFNARVQWLKYSARGFRNRQRFRNAILLPLRRPQPLSQRPHPLIPFHTKTRSAARLLRDVPVSADLPETSLPGYTANQYFQAVREASLSVYKVATMTQLDDNLSSLRTSVETGRRLAGDPENLLNYVTNVVTHNLENVLRELRAQVEEPHMLDEAEVGQPNVVVHYTSIATLVSMLKEAAEENSSSSLRLYDSNHFNDPDEGNFFDRNLDLHTHNPYKDLGATYSPHAYVASFIVPHDKQGQSDTDAQRDMSDNLVFWRTYGREGMGCSLTLVVPKHELRKVLYDRDAVRRTSSLLAPVLDSVDECLRPLFGLSSTADVQQQFQRTIARHIDKIRYLYKSKAYDYERECRLVIPEIDAQEDRVFFQYEEREDTTARIRHYYQVEALKVQNMFVTGSWITLGPRVPKPNNVRYYLESLLRKVGRSYGPKFRISSIPYQAS